MRVRPVRLDDLPAVYRICDQLGMTADRSPRTPELLGHVYAGPYVVGPGTRSVVAVDDQGPAGYLLCALDTEGFEAWREAEWWPGLRTDHPLEIEGRSAADQEVVELIHAPPMAPPGIAARYPAHLHIDMLPRIQRRGIGRQLISELIEDLARRGIRGVHLDVGSDNSGAIRLYRSLGFVELERAPGSVFMGREIGTAP
jgi:ribosomal protein S18 acetylase RimI-like enzyme